MKFTHLHLHTSYSLLDGAIRIPDLMQHCLKHEMDSVAITDHGNMFGAIEFYKEAKAKGIKPIIGNEFYVAPGSRKDQKTMDKVADGNNYHLILLAANKTGYSNLIKLTSRSYTEGFFRKPRIDIDLLSEYSDGLICLSACLGGEIQNKFLQGRDQEAEEAAQKFKDIFGPERFYLEIQNHGIPEEMIVAKKNVELSKKLGIPLVLTNDAHFLRREDHEAQDILLRINSKRNIDEPLPFNFTPEFYVKTSEEMCRLFPELPEAVHNTQAIAEKIDLSFQFGNPLLPRFEVPKEHTLDSYLKELSYKGLIKRYGGNPSKQILDRFEFEYNTITKMDFSGYFLIVQDFIDWARQNKIPVGPGRGSAAGSVISYSLGITDIDPLKYDLLFERFLNPDRNEMPDIDIDFCTERREEVIQYARQKYGEDKVGQIVTYGTMSAKACLKDVARVMNIPYEEANQISKKFPDALNISLSEALEISKELREYSEKSDLQKKIFSVALSLEGNARQTGVHAAGIVIAPDSLENIVPLATVAARVSSGQGTQKRVLVTQYDKNALEKIGLVKMDFLGLRNLTVIDRCLNSIRERLNQDIDITKIELTDKKTYRLLQSGDLKGIFQLESSPGMREFVLRIKPSTFSEIIALIALFRPGPLRSGMADTYINRKSGKEKVSYTHPALEEILCDTYGVIVYQEQVMLISRKIGGFTPGESDTLRKAMGKKDVKLMEELKLKFINGAQSRGFEKKFAEDLYGLMSEFAQYGFNKSHSAAYAMIVYHTAYLKANFPTDYMCALLDSEIEKIERLVPYINSCREMNIELLGPDINESKSHFSCVADGKIRFGLNGIKNVGLSAVESILIERDKLPGGKFESFFQVMESIDLKLCNRRTLESLIFAGAFSSMNYTRKVLIESLDIAIQHGQKIQSDKKSGQTSLFFDAPIGETSSEPIPRNSDVTEFNEGELLKKEKEVLGFYFSGHPLSRMERQLKSINLPPIDELSKIKSGSKIEIAGIINEFSIRLTKNQKEMCRLTIEDMTGNLQCTIFPARFEKIRNEIILDGIVIVAGTLEKNEETETIQFLVDNIKPLNRDVIEERMEKSFHLKLIREKFNKKDLTEMYSILQKNHGNLNVFFHLVPEVFSNDPPKSMDILEDYRVIRAHASFNVKLSQSMLQKLQEIGSVQGIYLSVGNQYRSLI